MNIMIIGGYGQVGSFVVRNLLAEKIQANLVIAGRNLKKAEDFVKTLHHTNVKAKVVDVSQYIGPQLHKIDTVVMCLEQNNCNVLDACIKAKVNYIDITPSTRIMQELVEKREQCQKAGIKVVLGVGIAPGLSNQLAICAAEELDQVETIDSYLMLGVGEQHGQNAIAWLIDNLNKTYITDGKHGKEEVKSFHERTKQRLQNGKNHTFTRIDLADSMINRERYPGARCNSWFAYDVNSYTKMVSMMQRCGMLHLLKYQRFHSVYQKIFTISMKVSNFFHIGTDRYEVIVNACGTKDGEFKMVTKYYSGNCNNKITARVTAEAVQQLNFYDIGMSYYTKVNKSL